MVNILSNKSDSISFLLQKEIVDTNIDTTSYNDILPYEYLPVDSTKFFYDVDAIKEGFQFSGLEGALRPVIDQFSDVIFLVFAFLLVLSSLVFRRSGPQLFSNLGDVSNTISGSNKRSYNEQALSFGVGSYLLCLFQTIIVYAVLFLYLLPQEYLYVGYDYLILFSQFVGAFTLFIAAKYLFYKFLGAIFSPSRANDLIKVYSWVVCLTGIISFIPIVAYIYIPEIRFYVLLFLSALFIVGRIAVIVQSYNFFMKSHIGILYFFVYLCAVEIMPYFLIYTAVVLMN